MIPFGAYTHTLHDCIFCVYLYALPWQPQSGWLYVSLCRFSYSRRLKIYFFNFFYFFRAAIDCGRGGGGNENDRRLLLCGVVCTWRNRFFYLRWRLETCLISSNLKRGKRRGCSKIKLGEGEGGGESEDVVRNDISHTDREKKCQSRNCLLTTAFGSLFWLVPTKSIILKLISILKKKTLFSFLLVMSFFGECVLSCGSPPFFFCLPLQLN